tara:strand:+ start:1739 stop:1981 length:243 start_codon:yes stop_codon:yes gene_type:complete
MKMYSFEEQPEQQVDSEYITEQAMDAIYALVIEPMEDRLTEEDATLIGVIGMALKAVANKAKAYEDMQMGKGGFSHHSRN